MLVRLCRLEDRPVLEGLYTAHLKVLAGYNPNVDPSNTLQDDWFEKPGVLFPYLLEEDRVPAGFALVGNEQLTRALGMDADFVMFEYHVAASHRRRGLGAVGLDALFKLHPGSWCLDVLPTNEPAMRFWTKELGARGAELLEHVDEDDVRFQRFVVRV